MSRNILIGGRKLMRVPMDFDWPHNKVWEGYLSPPTRPCPADDCENGYTTARLWVERAGALLLLAAEAPEKGRLHPWLEDVPLHPGVPGVEIREVTGGLAGRPYRSPFGHDAIDRWSTTKAILRAAGLSEDWGICEVCKGHATHPDDIAGQEAWEPTEPPEGEGYQLWESVSEGSPVSPVFASAVELADWLAPNHAIAGATQSVAEWRRLLAGDATGIDIASGRMV